MDAKTLSVLEYPKILARLAGYCDFSASKELALTLVPTHSYDLALDRLAETSEARRLLAVQDVGVGGAHDIRPAVDLAARRGVLEPQQLLEIKATLISCRELKKTLERKASDYPHLAEIALGLPQTYGLVEAITRVLSERGEVLDSASEKLARLRREIKATHDRLMGRLQRYLTELAPKLQEQIITQRDGRYVIPLRAEFKGQVKAIIHDQSASGATLFVEPLPIVEINNQLRELQLQERDEERRILAELSAQIGQYRQELIYGVENLAALDLAFAKAKYAEELKASEPLLRPLSPAKGHPPTFKLLRARHPLLDPETVVPIDFNPPADTRAVIITGPNTGGKTVALKTVGLLTLMAQSGLHIPAQSGSELPFYRSVYADIGDEQSIEQSLSTFSGHITNIIHILKNADEHSLVMLDELGAGTDPQEGAALARAILSHLLARGITTLVTTHHPELKTFAHVTPGVVNASVEFDLKTLRPTYQLTIGLPGRSNAIAIAQRLGLDPEIVAAAKSEIHPDEQRADKLLDDIRKERNRLARERQKMEKSRAHLEAQAQELQKRLERIEEERREILARARAEGELEVEILKQNLASLKAQLKKARQPLEVLKAVEEKVEALGEKITQPVERHPAEMTIAGMGGQTFAPFSPGDRVLVSSLNAEGVISALGESEAEVQVGSLRVRARLSDLKRKGAAVQDEEPREVSPGYPLKASPRMELDLRGQMTEDALEILDRYLEQAYLARLPFVRIIHGKGTGALRQAVRQALRGHPHVRSFEDGDPREGGDGVTIVKLVN
ncbi:MAG: endonuclease MutS2 [Anaerolineae bacterium]